MLEPKVNNFEHSEKPEIEIHETDILIIGGGMAYTFKKVVDGVDIGAI